MEIKDLAWSGLNFNHMGVKGIFKIDSSKAYDIDMSALLDSSKIKIKGEKIYGGSGSVQAEFSTLYLFVLSSPLSRNIYQDCRGNLSGKINLSSSEDQDNILGELYISDAM